MLTIISSETSGPAQFAFEPYLFNKPSQLFFQDSSVLIFTSGSPAEIFFSCFIKEQHAVSPLAAPFGGIQSGASITTKAVNNFLEEVESELVKRKVKKISLRHWPECYEPVSAEIIREILSARNWKTSIIELNQHLELKDSSFEKNIHDSERRRLQKCRQSGFTAGSFTLQELEEYYEVVRLNRIHKGHPLTVSQEKLKEIISKDPASYELYAVRDGNKIIAAAIGVIVHPEIMYYYLPGSLPEYASDSPMVLLLEHMYQQAYKRKMKIFDLGISTSGGIRNEGLIRFKQHLGALSSDKCTYEKEL